MNVRKHFFENYRDGHDLWTDMTSMNTVFDKIYKNSNIPLFGFQKRIYINY